MMLKSIRDVPLHKSTPVIRYALLKRACLRAEHGKRWDPAMGMEKG